MKSKIQPDHPSRSPGEPVSEPGRADSRGEEGALGLILFNTSPLPVLIYDRERRTILASNPAAARHYGYTQAELGGMSVEDLCFAGEEKEALARLAEDASGTARHRRKDGTPMEVEFTASPLVFSGREARLFHAVDVTEKKEFEARFLRAQRLECIGSLASGVAHDLNNILAPIMMSAAMLHDELAPEVRKSFLKTIEQSAQRGVNLLRQVLTFSKGVEGEHVPLRPEALVGEVADIARQTFPKAVEIKCRLAPDLWPVMADATRVHQVLLNLAINARDAMEHGGLLTITAENRELDAAAALTFHHAKPGRYVTLGVRDTGVGMSPEVFDNIFTPFFTTKEEGKGTGLGLPTVLSIVKSHGGFIDVSSEPGRGSAFEVYFPAARPAREPGGAKSVSLPTRGDGEAVLVVDDEAGVRRMVKAILTRHGYKVITAADGTEAMAEYVRRPNAIKLVLADLVMPSMDGVVLSRAIKSLNPNAQIVATSGVDTDPRIQELASLGVTRFLRKPYHSAELLDVVAQVIRTDPPREG